MEAPTQIKTDCPCCGGQKKLKTKITYIKGDALFSAAKCFKCGFKLPAAGPTKAHKGEWTAA